uniref:VWFA domain-containing protein n=1 Tax=Anopheles farauti TaxID=69004 RepID=A0A9I3GJ59_9DIPT
MTVLVFLLDNTPSMAQQTAANGEKLSYLDIAKRSVDLILKKRERTEHSEEDQYLLMTFDRPPDHVKACWTESLKDVKRAVSRVQITGTESIDRAIRRVFRLLNLERMVRGCDTYGSGRIPACAMPTFILLVTNKRTVGCDQDFVRFYRLPSHDPGALLTRQPYRWDQRLFSLVLRIPAHPPNMLPYDHPECSQETWRMQDMCRITGGMAYEVESLANLKMYVENLLHRTNVGMVVSFAMNSVEKVSGDGVNRHLVKINSAIIPCKTETSNSLATFNGNCTLSWPIPESYTIHSKLQNLPSRNAHPQLHVLPFWYNEPQYEQYFPVDKYHVCNHRVCRTILAHKCNTNMVKPIVLLDSNQKVPSVFGYLKPDAKRQHVHLFVLPFNYPELISLLDEFRLSPAAGGNRETVLKMTNYVKSVPAYYYLPLRKAFQSRMIGAWKFIPHPRCSYLPHELTLQIKFMSFKARKQRDKLFKCVQKQLDSDALFSRGGTNTGQSSKQLSSKQSIAHFINNQLTSHIRQGETVIFNGSTVTLPITRRAEDPLVGCTNLHDVNRRELIAAVMRMRHLFYHDPAENIARAGRTNIPSTLTGQHTDFPVVGQEVEQFHDIPSIRLRRQMLRDQWRKKYAGES